LYQQKGFTGRATYSRRISQSIETLVQHYRLNNCLWELEAALDLDGFGGGNGKNATATDSVANFNARLCTGTRKI
jgi:hypothetical protein